MSKCTDMQTHIHTHTPTLFPLCPNAHTHQPVWFFIAGSGKKHSFCWQVSHGVVTGVCDVHGMMGGGVMELNVNGVLVFWVILAYNSHIVPFLEEQQKNCQSRRSYFKSYALAICDCMYERAVSKKRNTHMLLREMKKRKKKLPLTQKQTCSHTHTNTHIHKEIEQQRWELFFHFRKEIKE